MHVVSFDNLKAISVLWFPRNLLESLLVSSNVAESNKNNFVFVVGVMTIYYILLGGGGINYL